MSLVVPVLVIAVAWTLGIWLVLKYTGRHHHAGGHPRNHRHG